MTEAVQTLRQLKKASKLTRLAFHENGPRSYQRGVGDMMRVRLEADGQATQRELVDKLDLNRGQLKDVVKKAVRNGFATSEDADGERTYAVRLTDEGREVAEKRLEANERAAEEILSALSTEERAQLDALTEKLIVSLKEAGVSGKGKGRRAHKHHGHRHGCR
ncbi:MAG: MarR family transcriptional regulator [Berryella intestinalis]|nr:MarR family transcriptional regulator [Berryella intestinalis]